MENLLVVHNVVDVVGGDYATVEEAVAGMAPYDLLVVGDGHTLIGAGTLVPEGVQDVQFLVKLKNGDIRSSVSIPRRNIRRLNAQVATSATLKVLRIGGTALGTGLVIPSTGEGNILLKNMSYNHAIATQRVSVSVQKKATETAEQYIDRVVVEINAAMALQAYPFATAAKVGASPDFAITFTVADTNVDLSVGVDGIFADYPAEVITEMAVAIGAGKDILAMEKEMSRHLGNGNYEKNPDLWYKAELQADANTSYNVLTLNWEGIAPTPTNTIKAADNSLTIAVRDDTSEFMTVARVISSVVGSRLAITIDGDFDATDGGTGEPTDEGDPIKIP